jgi:hypothetical protein
MHLGRICIKPTIDLTSDVTMLGITSTNKILKKCFLTSFINVELHGTVISSSGNFHHILRKNVTIILLVLNDLKSRTILNFNYNIRYCSVMQYDQQKKKRDEATM